MSTFLAFIAKKNANAADTFKADVDVARSVKLSSVGAIKLNAAIGVASFKRMDGSCSCFIEDINGNWLLLVGTYLPLNGKLRDPAFLLASALDDPYKLASELDGFFALLVGEGGANPRLYVITDPNGSFHVYSRMTDSGVFVSSSSLILAAVRPVNIDPLAAQEFVATGVIYEERSLYSDVRKLIPAAVYSFTQDACRVKNYWNPFDRPFERESIVESADRLWTALTAAASSVSEVASSPICDLTGGYDSRILNAVCKHIGMDFTTTVTGTQASPDVHISRKLAHVMEVPHTYCPTVRPSSSSIDEAVRLGDGEIDAVEYARVLEIHKSTMSRFDYSFNGSYGEVARGYWWELLGRDLSATRPLDIDRVAVARFIGVEPTSAFFRKDIGIRLREHFAAIINRAIVSQSVAAQTTQMDLIYIRLRMQRWQGRIASSTDQIRPCLSPLGLRRVLDVVLTIPPTHRHRSRVVRCMLDRYAQQIANVPLEHGYPAVPFKLRNGHRFLPLLDYFAKRIAARIIARLPGHRPGVRSALDDYRPDDLFNIPFFNEASLSQFFSKRNNFVGDVEVMGRLRTLESAYRLLSRASAHSF